LIDLRKNRQIITKVTPDNSFNLPLNKTTVNETVSAGREGLDKEYFTPSKNTDRGTENRRFGYDSITSIGYS
jgi:hypothetical protein